MSSDSLLARLKRLFPIEEHGTLDRFASQPEFVAAAARVEQEKVAARKEQLAQHAALPGLYEQRQRDAHDAEQAAAAVVAALKDQLRAAEQRYAVAYSTAMGVSLKFDAERGRLEAAIVDSASPLIAEAISALRDARDSVRHLVRVSVVAGPGSGRAGLASNHAAVAEACQACDAARQACEALRWQALSTAEVRAAISAVFRQVATKITVVGGEAPMLSDDGIKLSKLPPTDDARAAPPGTAPVAPPEQRGGAVQARAAIRSALS